MKVEFDYFRINNCLAIKFHLFREEMLYSSAVINVYGSRTSDEKKERKHGLKGPGIKTLEEMDFETR